MQLQTVEQHLKRTKRMKIDELIELLPKHPTKVYQDGFGTQATENGFYLYEIHKMHHDFYESHVWIFKSIEEFVNFLPAIVFNDIAVHWEDDEFDWDTDNYDYSNDYDFYKSLINQQWDFQQCIDFINNHNKFGELELIEFGKISDLVDVSQVEYDKCEEIYLFLDELENLGLTQGRYQIFHKFHAFSDSIPSKNKAVFMEMLEHWD